MQRNWGSTSSMPAWVRAMVDMALAKWLYSSPTWTKTVALAREHAVLR